MASAFDLVYQDECRKQNRELNSEVCPEVDKLNHQEHHKSWVEHALELKNLSEFGKYHLQLVTLAQDGSQVLHYNLKLIFLKMIPNA
jgi:hypothetical protein